LSETLATTEPLSVVIACRNEAKNLNTLMPYLKNQTNQNFELILINDHSVDDTWKIMNSYKTEFKNIKLLNSDRYGKKQALHIGIVNAKNDYILTTDADCLPHQRWIETIAAFKQKSQADLVVGPVVIKAKQGIFEKWQQTEFQSLIISGAGAIGSQLAFMCNGANLAFKKSVWLQSWKNLHHEINSGDDVFLLHQIKKTGGNIQFIKSPQALVSTSACSTLQSFVKQRKRWASKSPYYRDFATIFIALSVFSISILQIWLLIKGFLELKWFMVFALIWVTKWSFDFYFLKSTSAFFGCKNRFWETLSLSFIYPFYIIYTAILGISAGIYNKLNHG